MVSQIQEIHPRIGHAGYASHYHNGNSQIGSFTFQAQSIFMPLQEWTVKTSGFPTNATITIDIFDPNMRQVNTISLKLTGNEEQKNKSLIPGAIMSGTYTVRYNVFTSLYDSAPGTIEVWIY
ncbi:MAG: hypothetical protein ACLUD1_05815 [Clostridia bacterium]